MIPSPSHAPAPGNNGDDDSKNDLHCPGADFLSDRLLNALQTSVIFFDGRGTILRLNEPARDDLHTHSNPVGRRLYDVIAIIHGNKDILPGLMDEFANPQVEEVRLPADVFVQCKESGARFFVSGCIARLEDDRFLLSFRNIVEQLTQEYMFKMALSATKIFPWFFDMGSGKMIIDPRYYEYTGIPTTDYSMSLEEFSLRLHPDDRAQMAEAFERQLNGIHYPYPVPFRLLLGDGSYEWFEGQSTYLGQVEGLPYRVVGVCMSTQAHKDIEEALTAARDKAQESDRLKSAFLANMSHELRTPLNAIVGFSSLLTGSEEQPDSDEAREYAALISKNCDRLLTLVSDILDLSRIETDTMEYNLAEQPLGPFLTDIYEKHKDCMPEGVACNLCLPPDDIRIATDALRLRQVMDHLIANAMKFTEKGHIDIGYACSGDTVRLFVADTGRGIPADQAERIFERFYKVDSFVQGAGLGLSICKTIAERLGGRIGVSSRPGEGSRFTLALPLHSHKTPA